MKSADLTPLEQAAISGEKDADGDVSGAWLDMYLDLKASGLDKNKAAFVAWHAAPKKTRQPRTMAALAEILGYASEQVFYKWKHQDWFKEAGVDKLRESVFINHVADVDRVTIAKAKSLTGTHNDRKLFYEQMNKARGEDDENSDILSEWWEAAQLEPG